MTPAEWLRYNAEKIRAGPPAPRKETVNQKAASDAATKTLGKVSMGVLAGLAGLFGIVKGH